MRNARKLGVLGAAALGGLALLNLYGWLALGSARTAADRARAGTIEAASLAAKIRSLTEQPSRIGTRAIELEEFARRTEAAAAAVELSPQNILRIAPSAPRRVADSPYVRQEVQVILREAKLAQVLRLMRSLEENAGLRSDSLRLTAPRGDGEQSGRWQAELALSYLVYAPEAQARSATGRDR